MSGGAGLFSLMPGETIVAGGQSISDSRRAVTVLSVTGRKPNAIGTRDCYTQLPGVWAFHLATGRA